MRFIAIMLILGMIVPRDSFAVRYHMITWGENLSSISMKYYGTPNCWDVILKANPRFNKKNLKGKIPAYRSIVIPEVAECKGGVAQDLDEKIEKTMQAADETRPKEDETTGPKIKALGTKSLDKDLNVKTEKVGQLHKIKIEEINETMQKQLAQALGLYKKGLYPNALELLTPKKYPKGMQALIYYWKGLCQSRLQNFADALVSYETARKGGFESDDLDYEIGQAYYSQLSLSKGIDYFQKSYDGGFKKILSLYHIAYSYQLMGELENAHSFYGKLSKEDGTSKEMTQIALYERANIDYELKEDMEYEKLRIYVQEKTLPDMKDAMLRADSTSFVQTIQKRMYSIRKKFDLLPKPVELASGRKVGPQWWNFNASQNFNNDSNVIFQPDDANQTQTETASLYSMTSLFGKYLWVDNSKRFTVSPEASFTKMYYFERNVDSIIQNDSHIYGFNVRSTWDGKIKELQTTFIFDVEYSRIERDVNSQENIEFFGKSFTFNLGGSIKWPDEWGTTRLRLRLKPFTGYQESIDSDTKIGDLNHSMFIKNFGFLNLFGEMRITDSETDTNDLNSITFRGTLMRSREFWKIDMTYNLALRLVDPKNVPERGLEKEFNPSISAGYSFMQGQLKASATVDYLKYISDDKENFQYSRFMYGLGISYSY